MSFVLYCENDFIKKQEEIIRYSVTNKGDDGDVFIVQIKTSIEIADQKQCMDLLMEYNVYKVISVPRTMGILIIN